MGLKLGLLKIYKRTTKNGNLSTDFMTNLCQLQFWINEHFHNK